MLETLRNAAGTWVAKGLLLLLVLSFAAWGISGQISGRIGGQNVVTAGKTTVSINEYRLAYDRQLAVLSQQFGQRITREQATAFGIDQQVLAQLVAGAVLDEQARQMGLGLSKERLADLTREDPAFQGPGGRFDRRQFDFVLQQVGMRPADYLESRAKVAVRQQIVEAVSDGMKVPDTFLHAVALYRGEDRTVDYITLPQTLVEPIAAPSDEVLAKWFEENKKRYAAPEYRKIAYVKLEPADIADPSAVTDEQVKADYEANKARYTTPETRTIEQIVFKSPEAAKAARGSIDAGSTFEDVARAEGKSEADTLLGTFTKDQVADKAVAEAAFALKQSEVSDVVAGAFGPVLVRVTDIKPEVVRPFSEVKEEIRKDLALSEASRVLLDVHDAYEDARAGGDSLADAAEKLKLKVVTIDAIDRTARRPDGSIVNTIPSSQDLLKGAFETEVGVENPPLNTNANGYVFYEVQSITPARDRTLDEVRAKAVSDWTEAEAKSRLAAKAAEIRKRLESGTTLDAIAAELSLEKQTKRGLKRETDDADFGKAGVAEAFSVPEGASGTMESPQGDAQIVFKVVQVFEPAGSGPDSVPEEQRKVFASGMSDDLLDQLVAWLQTEYSVSIDQTAVQRALAL